MTVLAERPDTPAFLDDLPPSSGLAVRRWTPDEFRRMTAAGLFGPDELDGTELTGKLSELASDLPRLLNRAEYYALAEHGILGPDERTELIYGRIIKRMSPMNRPHSIGDYRQNGKGFGKCAWRWVRRRAADAGSVQRWHGTRAGCVRAGWRVA